MTDVFMDERFIGVVENAPTFLETIKEERRKGNISDVVNFYYDMDFNEIIIETSRGRARRPAIVVKNGKNTLTTELIEKMKKGEITWDSLRKEGIIEYLDAAEEENALVALDESELTKDHTHLEISPILMLGCCTAMIPYSNFGSSSRLIRGSKIQKQSLGVYCLNFLIRVDTDSSILHYAQRPIVKTFVHDIFHYDMRPAGQNVVIALMSYGGYNMQDAIILNKGSIDRGLARSSFFQPYVAEELRYSGGLTDTITIPDKEVKGYRSEKDYRYLEEDGMVYTEAKLKPDDALIGKISPPRFLGELEEMSIAANIRRESSVVVKHGESGVVDMTYITENEEGNRLIQVRLRDLRIPEIGDKFASRHGQKGVIGLIIPYQDLPFTASGITPDLIFSPHSIPSRMTISHLIEMLAGKVGALKGEYIDASTFDTPNEAELRQHLLGAGFRDDGTEEMYNGITGERMFVRIYVGNIYYLKLKHMVANKLHARAAGRIQLLTRQPIEGRAKGGGLRLGEMEKDCLVAHGASLLLKERFDSDKTILYVCEDCGLIAVYDSFKNKTSCPRCGVHNRISAVEMSYAFKLLLDELRSLGIYPKLELTGRY